MIEVVETAACEISSTPASIKHNNPTRPKSPWTLSFHKTGLNGIFTNPGKPLTVRGPNEGWTEKDIQSFGAYLASR